MVASQLLCETQKQGKVVDFEFKEKTPFYFRYLRTLGGDKVPYAFYNSILAFPNNNLKL